MFTDSMQIIFFSNDNEMDCGLLYTFLFADDQVVIAQEFDNAVYAMGNDRRKWEIKSGNKL